MVILFTGFLLITGALIILGVRMDALNSAVARLQASINVAISKIDSLKANQADPAALQAIADSLNASADALDAKTA